MDECSESTTTYIYIYIYIYSRINHSSYNQHTYNIYITSVLKIILFTRKTKQKTNTCRTRDYWGLLIGTSAEPITNTENT